MSLEEIYQELEKIKQRNKKVETDKAWEWSITRKILLMIFTYLALWIYMQAIGIYKPRLNAIIPSIWFLLSTLTLPRFKKLRIRHIHKK
jgi:sterol desaturase/sphingolipid hydroxylase (fatty acid hydroxylase superfamily)